MGPFFMHLCSMKFLSSSLFLITLLIIASCNQRHKTHAKIFERKHLPGNKLQIKYQYKADGKLYTDSASIENHVLQGDTITIKLDPKNPAESSPE